MTRIMKDYSALERRALIAKLQGCHSIQKICTLDDMSLADCSHLYIRHFDRRICSDEGVRGMALRNLHHDANAQQHVLLKLNKCTLHCMMNPSDASLHSL